MSLLSIAGSSYFFAAEIQCEESTGVSHCSRLSTTAKPACPAPLILPLIIQEPETVCTWTNRFVFSPQSVLSSDTKQKAMSSHEIFPLVPGGNNLEIEVNVMKTATSVLTKFFGGININRPMSVSVKSANLVQFFPHGIPVYTVMGGLHFSFRKEGNNVFTTVRKVLSS